MESKSGRDCKSRKLRFWPHHVVSRENVNSILSLRKKKADQVGGWKPQNLENTVAG